MGECYYQLGQINNAVDKFTTIEAQRGSKHPDALIMLGNCYYKIGDYEQAKTYWNTLISSYPSHKLTRIAQRKVAKLEN
jgi:TolA-binding protein